MRIAESRKLTVTLALVAPAFLIIFCIYFYPFIYVFKLSLFDRGNLTGWFFNSVFHDGVFWISLLNTFKFTLATTIGYYIVGLVAALILNTNIPWRTPIRGLVFLPWVVPMAITSVIWRWMLLPSSGIVNHILRVIGFQNLAGDWLGDLNTVFPTVVLINIWRDFPFFAITLLAGLQLIPKEIKEAAQIDGCNAIQSFFKITLPSLSSLSILLFIYETIISINNFEGIWLLTRGGPLYSTETLATYIYKQAFQYFQFNQASATGILTFVLIVAVILLITRLGSKLAT